MSKQEATDAMKKIKQTQQDAVCEYIVHKISAAALCQVLHATVNKPGWRQWQFSVWMYLKEITDL